jgi:hypothetical protein
MEKSNSEVQELEHTKTIDLVNRGGILLDVEGRNITLKTASDGHVSLICSRFLDFPLAPPLSSLYQCLR